MRARERLVLLGAAIVFLCSGAQVPKAVRWRGHAAAPRSPSWGKCCTLLLPLGPLRSPPDCQLCCGSTGCGTAARGLAGTHPTPSSTTAAATSPRGLPSPAYYCSCHSPALALLCRGMGPRHHWCWPTALSPRSMGRAFTWVLLCTMLWRLLPSPSAAALARTCRLAPNGAIAICLRAMGELRGQHSTLWFCMRQRAGSWPAGPAIAGRALSGAAAVRRAARHSSSRPASMLM